jgi:lactoylglutathione lyase
MTFQTSHIGLNVTNIQQSKQFYQTIFGFEVAGESIGGDREFVLLKNEEELILTLWRQSNGRFPTDQPGLHHLAFTVNTIEEVQAVEEKVRQANVKLYHDGIVPHSEGASSGGIFFEDLDGIRLEVNTKKGADTSHAPSGSAPTCGFF